MLWIESHVELRDHPKLKLLCELLGLRDKAKMIGHLHLLWWWAITYCEDGRLVRRARTHLPVVRAEAEGASKPNGGSSPRNPDGATEIPLSAQAIADAAEWRRDAEKFVEALKETGWLDCDRNGILEIHDWWNFAGKLLERREIKRDQMRALRRSRGGNVATTSMVRSNHVASESDTTFPPTVPDPTNQEYQPDPPDDPSSPETSGVTLQEVVETYFSSNPERSERIVRKVFKTLHEAHGIPLGTILDAVKDPVLGRQNPWSLCDQLKERRYGSPREKRTRSKSSPVKVDKDYTDEG